jgi:hypothetical protein
MDPYLLMQTDELCNYAYLKDSLKIEYYTDEELEQMIAKQDNKVTAKMQHYARLNKASTSYSNKRPQTSYLRSKNNLFKNNKVNKLFETVIHPYKPSGAIIKSRLAKKYPVVYQQQRIDFPELILPDSSPVFVDGSVCDEATGDNSILKPK